MRKIIILIGITLAYWLLGMFGQNLAHQLVSPVWISSGLALAATLYFGYLVAPAIYLGSVLTNISYTHSITHSMLMGIGPVLSAIIGGHFIKCHAHGYLFLNHVKDILLMILFGAIIGPMVSATVGNITLLHSGLVDRSNFWMSWLTWWTGDAASVIMFTPAILAWMYWGSSSQANRWQMLEASVLFLCVIAAGYLSFWLDYPVEYLLLLCLLWAAFHFSFKGTTFITLLILGIAIGGTLHGHGPFIRVNRIESLIFLQIYNAVIAITALILTAMIQELHRSAVQMSLAMKKAEAAHKAKSAFLTHMSHELYTPLNHIVGYTGLIEEELLDGADPAELKRDLLKITHSANHLKRLVESVLDFSEQDEKKLKLELSNFDLRKLAEETLSTIQSLEKHQNTYCVKIHESVNEMFADRIKVSRILFNLLENASKFTKNGIISLEIEKKDDVYQFAIADTGIGMNREDIDNLFAPFQQVDNTTTRKHDGLGLGLVVSRLYVQSMGGEVSVKSQLGKGSVFLVNIPSKVRGVKND